jgi:hypothetical protein
MNSKFCYKEKIRKILTLSLFYVDPEIVFHMNDVTLNSFIFKLKVFSIRFQYYSYNGILVLLGISVLVQLSHALKVMLMLGVLTAYWIINIVKLSDVFDNYDTYVYLYSK